MGFGGMYPKEYTVLSNAIEQGCKFALNRVEESIGDVQLDRAIIVDKMHHEMMLALSEWFHLPTDKED